MTLLLRRIRKLTGLLATMVALTGVDAASAAGLPDPKLDAPFARSPEMQTAVFAGGCFWGVEAVFRHVKGVTQAVSGYAGGTVDKPTYERVSGGGTGHAESVRVSFDSSQVTYGQLLKVFFAVAHNPTELNRQGPDVGSQYRSAIFYFTDEQKRIAEAYVKQLQGARIFSQPIVTQIAQQKVFYEAETYHQNYLAQHPNQPYIVANDLPKLENLRRQFPSLYQ